MKRSILAIILFASVAHAGEPLYIVEDSKGIVTFTSRRPSKGVKYKLAGKDFGYSNKVAPPRRIYRRGYSRGRLSKVRPYKNQSYDALINKFSKRFAIDPVLVKAVIHVESAFRPNAISPKGAQGLMQIMPATAERFGARNVMLPEQNIFVGVKYLRWLLNYFGGQEILALAAYNAGEGAVDKYNGIPPYKETRNYVRKVQKAKRAYACAMRRGGERDCVF